MINETPGSGRKYARAREESKDTQYADPDSCISRRSAGKPPGVIRRMSASRARSAFSKPTAPPVVRKGYKILSPKPNQEIKVVLLSTEILEAHSHYQDLQSYPCYGVDGGCRWCLNGIPFRVKYYAAATTYPTGNSYLVELTAHAVETCTTLITPCVNLRGKYLTLRRKGMNRNSPVWASLEECLHDDFLKRLPEPFNVELAVLSLWSDPDSFNVPAKLTPGDNFVETILPDFGGERL